MDDQKSQWQPLFVASEHVGLNEFRSLMSGRVACIVIENFYPSDLCDAISQNVGRLGLTDSFSGDNVEARYSGRAAIEMTTEKEGYLSGVAEANRKRLELLGGQEDPLPKVLGLLNKIWPAGASVASENGRPYFAGVIRIFRKAVPHNDYAPRDMQGWTIASIKQQLSWNLYLQAPEEGGEFEIWNRRWVSGDEESYKHDPSVKKGYDDAVVKGYSSSVVEPSQGRFVIFDATNYHTIHDVKGQKQRLAMSSFIGVADESSPLVLWS